MSLNGIVDVEELAIVALSFAASVDSGGHEQVMRKDDHSLGAI